MVNNYWSAPVVVGWLVITMACFFAGISMGEELAAGKLHTEAIGHGHGLYCPTTGKFAWAGECEESE